LDDFAVALDREVFFVHLGNGFEVYFVFLLVTRLVANWARKSMLVFGFIHSYGLKITFNAFRAEHMTAPLHPKVFASLAIRGTAFRLEILGYWFCLVEKVLEFFYYG